MLLVFEKGQRFGRLTVIRQGERVPGKKRQWLCQCDCGSEPKLIDGTRLNKGRATSCGCLRLENLRKAIVQDLTGKTYHHLTVIKQVDKGDRKELRWLCKCVCGNEKEVQGSHLKSGETRSCGCMHGEAQIRDMTGQTYGRYTVLRRGGRNTSNKVMWVCQCSCGTVKEVVGSDLKSGRTQSCGCWNLENLKTLHKTHGGTCDGNRSSEYQTWAGMVARCTNERNTQWKNYGGRGITVCDRWKNSFEAFFEDMGTRPDGLTIDRIDNDKGYCKENCRWATKHQQDRNKRSSRFITAAGKTLIVSDWAKELCLPVQGLFAKLNKTTDEEGLITKLVKRKAALRRPFVKTST